jgi:hypothetical protein
MNVNVNDYMPNEVFSGNGTSLEDLQNLNKALEAGDITGRSTANLTSASGAPLKVESLEKTLKILSHQEQHIKLWKMIPKKAAFNTVEEFNQLSSYGADRGGSLIEGELPATEDSTYIRRAQLVKFYGVTKEVSHPMSLVNVQASVGNIIEREVKNGTLWVLRKINKALTRGNESIIPTEFNGLYAQHQQNDVFGSLDAYFESEVVVDLRGAGLTEAAIEVGAEAIIQNFGYPTHLVAPPKVLSKFVENFYGNKFIPINSAAVSAGQVGQNVQTFESQYGSIKLEYDIFMNPDAGRVAGSAATSTKAPVAIVPDGTAPSAVVTGDASSMWAAGDAGTYFYSVAGVNRYGEGPLTLISSSASTIAAAKNSVNLKFAAGSGGTAATGYKIYRTKKGGVATSTMYPIYEISTAQLGTGYDGGAAGLVRDRNRFIPNTAQAFLIQNDTEVYEFAQLAPLMKMDLAIIAPAYRFMVLLYGTPLLYAPKKMVRFLNVGTV